MNIFLTRFLGSLFVLFTLILIYPSKSYALNLYDLCGSFATSGKFCVISCQWEGTTGYCKNDELDYCAYNRSSSDDCYYQYSFTNPFSGLGCWNYGYGNVNCPSFTNMVDCESAHEPPRVFYGCTYGGATPPPADCHYVSDDGCFTGNCPDDMTGHGRGSCAVDQYWCTGGHMEGNCCTPSWGPCSVSCGGGTQTDGCGHSLSCNPQSCCTPSWGACSALCGGGVRLDGCGGSMLCNTQPCRWWQIKDADVTTNGDLNSMVPDGEYFGLPGGGGYSGVPAYGGSVSLTNLNVSADGWLANSAYSSSKMYNSAYFINSVPSEVTVNEIPSVSIDGSFFESGGVESFGYYWYIYDASLTHLDLTITSSANLGSRKVILIVKGANLNINGNINLTDGEGFFLGVTSGNMVVSPTVTNLEGIYVSDGSFSTGTLGAGSDSQLWVRGTIAGFGGISLQRDLSVNTTSAELFEYAPDQDLLFPSKLGSRPTNWREVAP